MQGTWESHSLAIPRHSPPPQLAPSVFSGTDLPFETMQRMVERQTSLV